jgi:hypothetical protein
LSSIPLRRPHLALARGDGAARGVHLALHALHLRLGLHQPALQRGGALVGDGDELLGASAFGGAARSRSHRVFERLAELHARLDVLAGHLAERVRARDDVVELLLARLVLALERRVLLDVLALPEPELGDDVFELASLRRRRAELLVARLVLLDELHVQQRVLLKHFAVLALHHLHLGRPSLELLGLLGRADLQRAVRIRSLHQVIHELRVGGGGVRDGAHRRANAGHAREDRGTRSRGSATTARAFAVARPLVRVRSLGPKFKSRLGWPLPFFGAIRGSRAGGVRTFSARGADLVSSSPS